MRTACGMGAHMWSRMTAPLVAFADCHRRARPSISARLSMRRAGCHVRPQVKVLCLDYRVLPTRVQLRCMCLTSLLDVLIVLLKHRLPSPAGWRPSRSTRASATPRGSRPSSAPSRTSAATSSRRRRRPRTTASIRWAAAAGLETNVGCRHAQRGGLAKALGVHLDAICAQYVAWNFMDGGSGWFTTLAVMFARPRCC